MKTHLTPREIDAFKRHLDTLELDSVAAYQSWCRAQGFDDAVKKHWRERRKEQLAAKRLATRDRDEAELTAHIAAMGMKTELEYQTWCRAHGFSGKLYKTRSQRVQERNALANLKRQAERTGGMRHTRRQWDTIERIYKGDADREELSHPYLQIIDDISSEIRASNQEKDGEAFLTLLRSAERQANFFSGTPVIGHLGPQSGNTFVEGLYALACHHQDWRRPVEEWAPDSHDPHRQFGGLARHLFAEFPVPRFMDAAWFKGTSPAAHRQQQWFKHIGIGGNIRTADIPVRFSKMMAHQFLEAPNDFPIEWALRWGQLFGMGGGEDLMYAIIGTRLGEHFEDDEFWVSVLHFFINNPMLDTAYVGPVVDYIHDQRYVAPDIVQPDGTVVQGRIPQPDFTMKGRTVTSMLRLVEERRGERGKVTREEPAVAWRRINIDEFEYIDEDEKERWTIEELLNEQELAEEGRRMNHCVRTYAKSCQNRQVSIWSMKVENLHTAYRQHLLTIAVKRDKSISQVRGSSNAHPNDSPAKKGRAGYGARKHYDLIKKGRRVMDMWIEREGLRMLKQT